MRAEPKPQWARSVERSRRALKHSDGLWNPSPTVGSRRPDATHSPRHPRLLDTRRVPLPTPQTTTCLTFRTNDWCVFRIFADTLEIWALLRMNLNGADGSQRWRMACKGFSADTTKLVSLQHRQLVDDPMNSRVSACGEMKAARTPNAPSPKSGTGHAGCG